MQLGSRLLGLVPRFQEVTRWNWQLLSSFPLGSLVGSSQRVGDVVPGGLQEQGVATTWPHWRAVPRSSTWTRWRRQQEAICKASIQPQGTFKGYTTEDPRGYPTEGYHVSFWLKPDVTFETLLRLDAATQGLCEFNGQRLRGQFFYPDVRVMAKEMLAPFDQPWPIFAKALPQWPLVKFDIMTKKKEDASALQAAVQPYVKSIRVFDRAKVVPFREDRCDSAYAKAVKKQKSE